MTLHKLPSRDPVADDWQVGDLALLVRKLHDPMPRPGSVHRVVAVKGPLVWQDDDGILLIGLGLVLDGMAHARPDCGCWAGNFRKIRPHQEDEDDREVIALLTYAERVTL